MDQINLAVRIKFVALIVGLPLIALAVYTYPKLVANAAPTEIIAVGAAGVALLALIYSALNHHLSNQIYSEQLRIQKIRSSMEIIDHFHVAEMATYIRVGVELRKEISEKNGREIAAFLNEQPEKKEALIAVLNYIESIGIVVRMNGAHEDMLREYFSPVIHRYWNALHEWVVLMRSELGTQDLFSEFDFLVRRWPSK